MTRALSVLVATLVLLGVGWYVGQRPAGPLRERIREMGTRHRAEVAELRQRAADAEARGYLWEARGRLLIASHGIATGDFEAAALEAGRACDLITRAASVPGMTLDVGAIRDLVEAALPRIRAGDPGARETVLAASDGLGRLLEHVGQA